MRSDADTLRLLYDSNPVAAKTSGLNAMKKRLCSGHIEIDAALITEDIGSERR